MRSPSRSFPAPRGGARVDDTPQGGGRPRRRLPAAARACYKRDAMADPPAVLRAEDLWKEYRDGEGTVVAALRGLQLAVAAGEVVTLLGRSGSGKTTLLNLLAGLDRPTRGSIEIEGADL